MSRNRRNYAKLQSHDNHATVFMIKKKKFIVEFLLGKAERLNYTVLTNVRRRLDYNQVHASMSKICEKLNTPASFNVNDRFRKERTQPGTWRTS